MTLPSSPNLITHCFKDTYALEVYLSKCVQQICNVQLELLGLYVLGAMTAKDLVLQAVQAVAKVDSHQSKEERDRQER